MKRVGILISGGGSNMEALVRSMQDDPGHPAQPVLVVSNNPDAGGLAKAQALGVATKIIDHRDFNKDRRAFDAALTAAFEKAGVDLIAEAGFLRIHDDGFPTHWAGRLLNIHPSLLPSFKGLRTHQGALDAGCTIHGCTVHEVVGDLDGGPILGQAAVPVRPDDTAQTLAARVLVQEHRLYPMVLRAFANDPESARRARTALFAET